MNPMIKLSDAPTGREMASESILKKGISGYLYVSQWA